MSVGSKAITAAALLVLGIALYQIFWSDNVNVDYFRSLGGSPWTAVLMIVSMGAAWAFALPASVFFFIVPLVYAPVPSAFIMTAGSTLGATTGYLAARFIGGPWIEQFRDHTVTQFLSRHATLTTLFALRVVPSSPHGFINYGAGFVSVPILPFLVATAAGTFVKAFVYAIAVHSAVEATSLSEALSWTSVASLLAVAALAVLGRIVVRRWLVQST